MQIFNCIFLNYFFIDSQDMLKFGISFFTHTIEQYRLDNNAYGHVNLEEKIRK